jgi:hypothetical protein
MLPHWVLYQTVLFQVSMNLWYLMVIIHELQAEPIHGLRAAWPQSPSFAHFLVVCFCNIFAPGDSSGYHRNAGHFSFFQDQSDVWFLMMMLYVC